MPCLASPTDLIGALMPSRLTTIRTGVDGCIAGAGRISAAAAAASGAAWNIAGSGCPAACFGCADSGSASRSLARPYSSGEPSTISIPATTVTTPAIAASSRAIRSTLPP